jgi:hypothetical protein
MPAHRDPDGRTLHRISRNIPLVVRGTGGEERRVRKLVARAFPGSVVTRTILLRGFAAHITLPSGSLCSAWGRTPAEALTACLALAKQGLRIPEALSA